MKRPDAKPLPPGTPVNIDIAQGHAVAEGEILESYWDDGWMYQVRVTAGDDCAAHREKDGQLWVCDFEVTACGG